MSLEGEIGEIDLIERLVELWRESFTGAIRFENDGIIKIIYFKGGDVLSASTNDRADSIDEILMRAGKVSRDHVKQALAKRKENETLGDALLNLGFITRKELTWARRVQVIGVIRSITTWPAGSFTIVADYLPKREEGTLFPLPQILIELIVTEQDRQRFERALEGGVTVFAKSADFDDVYKQLGLNDEADSIVAHIDGRNAAAEVALESGKDTFNAYKLIHALSVLGILTRVEPQASPEVSSETDEFSFESAGVSDAAEMWSEPKPAPAQPKFEFDEAEALNAPTLEIPIRGEEPRAATPSKSAWDDEDEPVAAAPVPPEKMPAWDTPPRRPVPPPIPAAIEPAASVNEDQWGFDEAQIETARRASVPVSSDDQEYVNEPLRKSRKPKRSYGLLIALMLIFILAGAAYAGWVWWQGQQETPAPVVDRRAPRRAPPAPQPPPGTETITTIAPVTETITTAAASTTAASTTTGGMTIAATPPPTPAPSTKPTVITPTTPKPTMITPPPTSTVANTGALPKVTPARNGGSRDRYEAMARDFAANASGNFTVQFEIVCEASNVAKALQHGGNKVWFVPITIRGRDCYRVFWGRYNTRDEAQRATGEIPAALRDATPSVVKVPK